jgi:hypothetical protein
MPENSRSPSEKSDSPSRVFIFAGQGFELVFSSSTGTIESRLVPTAHPKPARKGASARVESPSRKDLP